jgi:chromate transporter
MPIAILVALATLYDRFADLPDVRHALAGAAAATAGLVIGTAAKMIRNLKPDWIGALSGLAIFIAVAVLHVPLLLSLAVAVPLSLMLVHLGARRA